MDDPEPKVEGRDGRRAALMTSYSLSRRGAAVAVALLAISVLAAAWQDFTLGLLYHQADASYHLQGALRLLDGQVPYRDFVYTFPPLGLCLIATSFAIFGVSLWAAKLPTALLFGLALAVAYRWLRQSVSRRGALAGCFVLWLLCPFVLRLPYPLNLCLAPGIFALQQLGRMRAGRLRPALWAGLACGLCLGFKHNVGIVLGLAVWVRLLVVSPYSELFPTSLKGRVIRRDIRYGALICALAALCALGLMFPAPWRTPLITLLPAAVLTVAGCGRALHLDRLSPPPVDTLGIAHACLLVAAGTTMACAPWLFWLSAHDALSPFLGFGLVDSGGAGSGWVAEYGLRLGPRLAWDQLGFLVTVFAFVGTAIATRRPRLRMVALSSAGVIALLGLWRFGFILGEVALEYGCLGLLLLLALKRGAGIRNTTVAVAVTAGWFSVICFPAPTVNHAAIGLAPISMFAMSLVWSASGWRMLDRVLAGILIALPICTGWAEWASFAISPQEAPARVAGRYGGTWAPGKTVAALAGAVALVDGGTQPGEPIAAWPSQGLVAFLAGRSNPTALDHYWSGYVDESMERRLTNELAESRAPILLRLSPNPSFGSVVFENDTPQLHTWIRREYVPAARFDVWVLLLPKERMEPSSERQNHGPLARISHKVSSRGR